MAAVRFMLIVAMAAVCRGPLCGQDTGPTTIAAARKIAAQATGLKGPERDAFLQEALQVLRQVDERFPKDGSSRARAALESGRLLKRLGRLDEAVAAFDAAAGFEKEAGIVVDALLELSVVHRTRKDLAAAEAVLRKIIDQHGEQARDHAEALIRLASIQRQRREWSLAEETLRHCLATHADLWRQAVDALDDLVSMKIRNKDHGGARKDLDEGTGMLRARFKDSPNESKLESALERMSSRARLDRLDGKGETPGT